MFLSILIHSNQRFQTITQPFYMTSNRTPNKKSAGVLNIRRTAAGVIIIRAGGAAKNF